MSLTGKCFVDGIVNQIVEVNLKVGINRVLIKTFDFGGSHAFALSLSNPEEAARSCETFDKSRKKYNGNHVVINADGFVYGKAMSWQSCLKACQKDSRCAQTVWNGNCFPMSEANSKEETVPYSLFTTPIYGQSPGSNLGLVTNIESLEKCMLLCVETGATCQAVIYWIEGNYYGLTDRIGNCYQLDRRYQTEYVLIYKTFATALVSNKITNPLDKTGWKSAFCIDEDNVYATTSPSGVKTGNGGSHISTARHGCCPFNKYMSNPFSVGNSFSVANSCSACPTGQIAISSLPNDGVDFSWTWGNAIGTLPSQSTSAGRLVTCSQFENELGPYKGKNKGGWLIAPCEAGRTTDVDCNDVHKLQFGKIACRWGRKLSQNDDTSCEKLCPSTQVPDSDKAATNSIAGIQGDSVTVTCNTGWSGTKATVCGSNSQWNPIVECAVNSCTPTQVANSDKSEANSITGT